MSHRLVRVMVVVALLLGVTTVVPSSSSAHTLRAVASGPSWSSCPTPLIGAQYSAPASATRTVALTFDDGPGPSTARILSILNSFHVRATFFNIGENEAEWPQDVRAEAAEGFLIGDHTWSHPDLVTLSAAQQRNQLSAVGAEQRLLAGSSPCSFRPPYGDFDATTTEEAASLSLSVWMWSVDTDDWQAEGSASPTWVQRIVSLAESEGGAQSHPVVLMHNQSIPMPATVAALPTIIEYFLARHYRFVDLLGRGGPPDACGPTSATFAASPRTRVAPRTILRSGDSLRSPSGQYTLTQGADGALALVSNGRVLWSTPTNGHPRSVARVSPQGYFEVLSATGRPLWRSAGGRRGDSLTLADDGSLSLVTGARTWWVVRSPATLVAPRRGLSSGWAIYSPDAACRLAMNRAGQLVLQSAANGTLWTSRGVNVAHSSAVLESDGNFEIVSPTHEVLWASGSLGASPRVLISGAGRAVVQGRAGRWLWSTP